MTRPEEAAEAAAVGADAIGMVFVPGAARAVALATAQAIVDALPPWTVPVALFQDAPAADAQAILAGLPARTWVQFHGAEDAAACRAIAGGRPYIRAIPMASVTDVPAYAAAYPEAGLFVADAHAAAGGGGGGQCFDWARLQGVAARLPRQLLLAGGLTPERVGPAIAALAPWGLDVSSGIEGPVRGRKDPARMRAFARAAALADLARAGPS